MKSQTVFPYSSILTLISTAMSSPAVEENVFTVLSEDANVKKQVKYGQIKASDHYHDYRIKFINSENFLICIGLKFKILDFLSKFIRG